MLFVILFFFTALTSCSKKSYTSNDGEKIFSQITFLEISPRLIDFYVSSQQVEINECMLTTDFDPEKANLSMISYPDINEKQYKKFFTRKKDFEFYLHPIICDGMVYDVLKDGKIVAYELLEEGNLSRKWSMDILDGSSFFETKEKKGILASFARLHKDGGVDRLFISTSNGWVISVDVENRKVLWKKHFNTGFMASPTVGFGKLFLVSTNDEVYGIDMNTGDVIWTEKEKGEAIGGLSSMQTPPITLYKDKIIAGLSNGYIVLLTANEGHVIWKSKVLSAGSKVNAVEIFDIDFSPIVFGDKVVVAGGINSSIMGFDVNTGMPIWQIPTTLNSYILKNNQEFGFVVDGENNNICFNGLTGEIKAVKNKGNRVYSREVPAYLNDGKNYDIWQVNRYYDGYFDANEL